MYSQSHGLRPGRFDRQVMVELPDRQGRLEILAIHIRPVVQGKDINLEAVAQMTPGFSGADLANLVNEAALLASRLGKQAVEMADFDGAFERVVAGTERRSRSITPKENQVIAVHEAGHALIASLTPEATKAHKVTIVPRSRTLGYTMQLPTHDRNVLSEHELKTRLTILVGGRVAEALVFREASTGAVDDLALATDLARRILEEAVDQAGSILNNHRSALDSLADLLCELETVDATRIDANLSQIPEGLSRWENEGGYIDSRVKEENEASGEFGVSITLERSQENARV